MVFVPQVPHIPSGQVSLEAQELAREIEQVIADYQESHPAVRQQDVQLAFQLARARAGRSVVEQRAMILVTLGLVLMLGLLTAFFLIA